jgi:hypothetical protein
MIVLVERETPVRQERRRRRKPVRVSQAARELAATVNIREVATDVTDEIMDEVWSHRDEPGFYNSLDRSVYANIDAIFETLHARRAVDESPPVAALDFADTTAQVGIPAIELERAYRVGVASLWSQWFDLATDHAQRTDVSLDEMVRGPSLTFLGYIDQALVTVVQRADTVRMELQRTQSQLRRVLLLQILDGSVTDATPELDRQLNYAVRDVHLALLVQSQDPHPLQQEIAELRATADARDTLVLQNSPRSWFVWLGRPAGFGPAQLSALRRALCRSTLTVAVGEPAGGLEGLRHTYQQAFETAHLQEALGVGGHRCMWAADVRLEALLLRDTTRARQFVDAELGRLAANDSLAVRLRETLLMWLATGSHVSAAALLKVHENTVRNRVRQAEDLLGMALHQRRIELQVALRLERVLHAHEHPEGEFAPGRGRPLLVADGDSSWLSLPHA